MPKKKKTEIKLEEKELETIEHLHEEVSMQGIQEKWQMIELKTSLLSMSKDILERNAALKWEQDKTRGLSVNHDEIIEVARDLLNFILE